MMNFENSEVNPQQLFNQALLERIRYNREQVTIWCDYRERHVKVIEGLQLFPQELSSSCMVPIGKRALMRGKLTHTNEIMVCLGDGYFAKYTAPQAIALCNRRIIKADEMLERLKKEENLLETRQTVPDGFDVFGNDNRQDLLEHWNEEKIKDWKVEHRQREKEYRKRLAVLKNEAPTELITEEDIFKKLDALELQEELEDELNRLENERESSHGQSMDDGEYFDESEVESESYSSDYSEEAINEVCEKKPLNISHRLKILNNVNKNKSDPDVRGSFDAAGNHSTNEVIEYFTTESKKSDSRCESKLLGSENDGDRLRIKEKKVAFAEPQVKYFSNEEEMETGTEKRRISVIEQRLYEYSKEDDESENESDEDEIIRIHFKHSDNDMVIPTTDSDVISSPKDIYKVIPGPKSILKKTVDHSSYIKPSTILNNSTTEDESEVDTEPLSAYNTIFKEVKEHIIDTPPITTITESPAQKRPVSKFKSERAVMKK